ncbi:MAG: PaaX [Pseudomonadota bacterium]
MSSSFLYKAIFDQSPTPKRLILSLLSAPSMTRISAAQSAQWGQLFGIDPAAMRVALGRLCKSGFLQSVARGVYEVGPAGATLRTAASSWVSAEHLKGPWNGDWLLVHTAHLGRRDKRLARNRDRALRLEGFQSPLRDLWCRPANYRESLVETKARMVTLGMEQEAAVSRSSEVLGADLQLESLWPRAALEKSYEDATELMKDSRRRISDYRLEEAARETFLIGEYVIRQINADPMLPDEMIDGAARRKMHAAMLSYDKLGHGVWQRFQKQH